MLAWLVYTHPHHPPIQTHPHPPNPNPKNTQRTEHVKTISALQTNDDLPISPNAAAANAAWAVSADEAEEEAAEKTLEEDWISEGRGFDEDDRWWLEEPDYFYDEDANDGEGD